MDPSNHLRAVPDASRVSRHVPDPASAQRLEDLLIASGQGSAQAFEGVFAVMLTQVYRLALRVVRDPGMAEDVAQEALVEAWRKSPEFDSTRGTARAWVLTIAHRRAVGRVRREQRQRQRQRMEAEAAVAERESAPAEQDEIVERDYTDFKGARVRRAMASLSAKQRETVELAFLSGANARGGLPETGSSTWYSQDPH